MTELKHTLSVASKNSNRGIRVPPNIPANQTVQRTGNIASRKEFDFNKNEAGGAGSRSGNDNNIIYPFKTYFIRFTREMNK